MPDYGQRADQSADNYCYRHRDRQSFVLCQRCGRTICGECQTPAPVGVLCPDCAGQSRRTQTSSRPGIASRIKRAAALGKPVVTYAIMGLTAVLFLVQLVTGGFLQNLLLFNPITLHVEAQFEPWRLLTVTLVHGSIWHIAFNMLTLWLFGRVLEPLYGHLRFGLVWIAAALGGSLAVTIATPTGSVIGASGAVFGLFGAYFVVMRQARMNPTSLLVLIGINIVMGFVVPGIAWEAHVGGLLVGLLAGWLVSRDVRGPQAVTRSGGRRRPATGAWLVGGLALVLVVGAIAWANFVSPVSVTMASEAASAPGVAPVTEPEVSTVLSTGWGE